MKYLKRFLRIIFFGGVLIPCLPLLLFIAWIDDCSDFTPQDFFDTIIFDIIWGK
jgi:hypothetical protein